MVDKVGGLQYDKNRSGALEFEELHAVLADLGIVVSPFNALPEIGTAYIFCDPGPAPCQSTTCSSVTVLLGIPVCGQGLVV